MRRIRLLLAFATIGLVVIFGTRQSLAGYVLNADHTVTDQSTGLIWEQTGSAASMAWAQALAWCENATTGGHTDWRLPNKLELETLIEESRTTPPLTDPIFTGSIDRYWSSTTYVNRTFYAWAVDVAGGQSASWYKQRMHYARCVRGGINFFAVEPANLILLTPQ